MTHAAAEALDFPGIAPELFVIWSGTGHVWPDARRRTFYLSAKKVHTMNGSALHTSDWTEAKTFKGAVAAGQWMLENRRKRGQGYDGMTISTVAELILKRFPEPPTKKAKK